MKNDKGSDSCNSFNVKFGQLIKKRREELNLTQSELAAKLGYSNKSTLSCIEIGKNGIAVNRLPDFAEALETTMEYLIGWAMPEPAAEAREEPPQSTTTDAVRPTATVSPVSMPISPDEHIVLSLYRNATDFGKGKAVADLENNQSFIQQSIKETG